MNEMKENRAKWLAGIDNDFYCEKCGTYAGYAYRGSRKFQELTNYCKYCGARMENEVTENE